MKVVVTGGAGFIGSAIIWKLNQLDITNIIVTDILDSSDKYKNLIGLDFVDYIDARNFLSLLKTGKINGSKIDLLIHMGAITNTLEDDASLMIKTNYEYSKSLTLLCKEYRIRMIYASSAATYGNKYNAIKEDNMDLIKKLKPCNIYGYSKHLFDLWLLNNGYFTQTIFGLVGLKFSNVFGPNEYHKGNMRSMICKGYEQIKRDKKIKLFKSYNKMYKHGESWRDFIYIKDVLEYIRLIIENNDVRGIFNIGSGYGIQWNDLAECLFHCIYDSFKKPKIKYIDMPYRLREQYQYNNVLDIHKIENVIGSIKNTPFETAVKEYVQEYLEKGYRHLSDQQKDN